MAFELRSVLTSIFSSTRHGQTAFFLTLAWPEQPLWFASWQQNVQAYTNVRESEISLRKLSKERTVAFLVRCIGLPCLSGNWPSSRDRRIIWRYPTWGKQYGRATSKPYHMQRLASILAPNVGPICWDPIPEVRPLSKKSSHSWQIKFQNSRKVLLLQSIAYLSSRAYVGHNASQLNSPSTFGLSSIESVACRAHASLIFLWWLGNTFLMKCIFKVFSEAIRNRRQL